MADAARWTAYHTALLQRVDPKKFPTFAAFSGERPKAKTPEQIRAQLRIFIARSQAVTRAREGG